MPLVTELEFFARSEFKRPELVNDTAAKMLDEIRRQYGKPLVLTDDARVPGEMPPGASATSLHFKGQAFDLRIRDVSPEDLWKLVRAVINVGDWVARGEKRGVELELVWSKTDKHCHIGFFLGAGPANRLIIRTE